MIKKLPKYVYFCKNCENNFEIKHGLQKTCTICEICEAEGHLERVPSSIFLTKKLSDFAGTLEAGEVVHGTIVETYEDVAREKERLKKREYKK